MSWLAKNRTKIIGYVGVILGVAELNAATIGEWVSAPKRGTLMMIIGMITAAVGHYNSSHKDDSNDS